MHLIYFFRDIGIELNENISKDSINDYKYFLKSSNINNFYKYYSIK